MKFHGRITPGRITDLKTPLQVLIYAPAKLSSATIKIWEMDTFQQDGKTKSEGSADDLLATFEGAIAPAESTGGARAPEWRRFEASSSKIENADASGDPIKVKLQFGGSETIYEVPIKSEVEEVEGDSYEIGFSIEVGGAEKFRTKSPALVVPPMKPLRIVARYVYLERKDTSKFEKDTTYEEPLAYRHIALGTATTQDDSAKFKILGTGYTDGQGYLFEREPDPKEAKSPRPIIVRAGRELYILDSHEKFETAGVTEIPIARCDHVFGEDHDLVVLRSGSTNSMSLRIAERPSTGVESFGEAQVEAPALPAMPAFGFTKLTPRSKKS